MSIRCVKWFLTGWFRCGLMRIHANKLLNIMREAVIAEVSTQLSEVVGVIERHLEPTLLAVHLYGSAVDGGLKPHSDIDLLVTETVTSKSISLCGFRPPSTAEDRKSTV